MPSGLAYLGISRFVFVFAARDPLFEFAHARQVLVQLALIRLAEFAVELLGVLEGKIENALLILVAELLGLGRGRFLATAKEPLEHQPRIYFGRAGVLSDFHDMFEL